MRQEDKTVANLVDLINNILQDTKNIKQPIWYRGQEDKNWKLSPTIFRQGRRTTETELLKKFKQNATLFMNPRPASQYEWLFLMRHYGVPTRLIDWTESPLVGAYFSAESSTGELSERDGALWILLPTELNKQSNMTDNPDELPSEEDVTMKTYAPEWYDKESTSEILPVAFTAPRNSTRMQSQLSTFTIHHRLTLPIEDVGDGKHVWRYVIPREIKAQLKHDLGLLGIGRFQLFPELDSIGKCLKEMK